MSPTSFDRHPDAPSGLASVTLRAAFDREFRSALLANPHRAIRESLGIELPAALRLRFVEKPGDVDLLVVLPDVVDGALSAEELDRVPGGSRCPLCRPGEWFGAAAQAPA